MSDLYKAMIELSGSDFEALGLVDVPGVDQRTPGKPAYAIKKDEVSKFTIYWGYQYDANGSLRHLKPTVFTGCPYGLVSVADNGQPVVLNGVRIVFYSESLDPACKVMDVSVGDSRVRTDDNHEALRYIKRMRPDWAGFIEQSILCEARCLMLDDKDARFEAVTSRVQEVSVNPVSGDIIDIAPGDDPKDEDFSAPVRVVHDSVGDVPKTTDGDFQIGSEAMRGVSMPDWPHENDFIAFSDEFLNPPTNDDRPVSVHMKIKKVASGKRRKRSVKVSDSLRAKIQSHVAYWLTTIQHRKQDVRAVSALPKDGVQLVLSLRIGEMVGMESSERADAMRNWFRMLKAQIEGGTARRPDGSVAIEALSDCKVVAVRVAYP